jgi:undecaprenyl-diphosphatase
MTTLQVIIYAIVQGITELFPISSVGHSVILPYLLGWKNVSDSPQFLPFVVMLHIGTGIALFIYFIRDWIELVLSLFRRGDRNKRIFLLIVVATIPAAIIGKLLEKQFQALFPSALSAAIFLIVNGFVLFWADRMRQRQTFIMPLERMSLFRSFCIGVIQCLALIPGFSRSGVTMVASLQSRLSYEEAARFSFLLATPVILGAAVLEVPKAVHSHNTAMLHAGLYGGLLTGVIAFLSTFFLMRYFRQSEVRALRPFAWYCIIAGVIVAVLAALRIHF